MNEQTIASNHQHTGKRVVSMKRCSDLNNYYGRHVYMLTMAVEGQRSLLGQVLGSGLAQCSANEVRATIPGVVPNP